ncbi:nucleotidyl transferase AbiEii/AbiGii toxin family protein [Streptosporangium sp. NPDC049046]|uniref:nucleotidyl transferase AbiEii/AbiGii toxin family protein n=1 Tax=Streptosporangium sp. NPDC049046 TaxID=3155031 RepID=UPI0034252DCC
MSDLYTTPRAVEMAMKKRLGALAKQHGLNPSLVFRSFYFSRLAARVFRHDPDGWLLKGGQSLLLRYPIQARLSRDIDLQRLTASSAQEALRALLDAAALDLGDFFVFSPTSTIEHSDETGGAKQTFTVTLGTRTLDTIKVDLVVGRYPTDTPETVSLASSALMPWPDDWPLVQLYPLADHVADKICAMYERHQGVASSRFRDLADLLLISQREGLHGAAVQIALKSEVHRRTGMGTDLTLPDRFTVPDSSWIKGYPTAAAEVVGLRGCLSLVDAQVAADRFITPILAGTSVGRWNPRSAVWSMAD